MPRWNINAWRKWCVVAQREGPGKAYAFAGLHLRVNGHPCAALRMFERGAELNDGESYVWQGAIHIRGECGPADFPRALAAFETAVTLRDVLAQGWLEQIYEGKFGRTLRDPEKAAMWAFANVLLHKEPPARARGYGRRLALSEAQIDEAHERMRQWLVERKVLKE